MNYRFTLNYKKPDSSNASYNKNINHVYLGRKASAQLINGTFDDVINVRRFQTDCMECQMKLCIQIRNMFYFSGEVVTLLLNEWHQTQT